MNPARPQVRQGGGGKRQVPMRVPKMAELLATRIRRQIILGQLKEGELLLPEAQLSHPNLASWSLAEYMNERTLPTPPSLK